MQNRARFQRYTYTVNANSEMHVSVAGSTISCFESDGLLKIEFDSDGTVSEFTQGVTYPNQAFNNFRLMNDTNDDVSVVILVGQGDIRDSRLSVSGTLSVQNASGDILEVKDVASGIQSSPAITLPVGAAAAQLVAMNPNRKAIIIRNTHPVATAYIGGSDLDAANAQGIPLDANEPITLETTAAIYGQNASENGSLVLTITELLH